jgi:anti-sigma factor RsiW
MNCQEAQPLINLYVDGELDAARIPELEKHVHDCAACALLAHNAQTIKKSLTQDALFFTAPPELRRQITAELRSQVKTTSRWNFWNWNWMPATAGVAITCVAVLLIVTLNPASSAPALAQEVVSCHIRSLMANHMLDVVSTDQHTVKPWFNGKLDFSPPVKDLAAKEFPLIGGRLDYFGGHNVAALVFQRNKHVINLFIWPVAGNVTKPTILPAFQGYNVIHWSETGMTYWAVSDLNTKELMNFVQDFSAGETIRP